MRKFKLIVFIVFMSQLTSAQQKIEKGTYVAIDKLSYITIVDENNFTFLKYYKWSPYTLALEKEKDKNQVCGVVGYVIDGKGNGKYKIVNGKIQLDFTTFEKDASGKEISFLSFNISELEQNKNGL